MYFAFEIHFEKNYFVFCILRPTSKVFDKSISNTFFKSILYFVFEQSKKVSFTTLTNRKEARRR